MDVTTLQKIISETLQSTTYNPISSLDNNLYEIGTDSNSDKLTQVIITDIPYNNKTTKMWVLDLDKQIPHLNLNGKKTESVLFHIDMFKHKITIYIIEMKSSIQHILEPDLPTNCLRYIKLQIEETLDRIGIIFSLYNPFGHKKFKEFTIEKIKAIVCYNNRISASVVEDNLMYKAFTSSKQTGNILCDSTYFKRINVQVKFIKNNSDDPTTFSIDFKELI